MWAKTHKRTFHKWIVAPAIALFLASSAFAQIDKCSPDTLWPMTNGMGYYSMSDTTFWTGIAFDTTAWDGIGNSANYPCYQYYCETMQINSMHPDSAMPVLWTYETPPLDSMYDIIRAFVLFNTSNLRLPYQIQIDVHGTFSFEDACSLWVTDFRPKGGNPCGLYESAITDSHNFSSAFPKQPLGFHNYYPVGIDTLDVGWYSISLPMSFFAYPDTTSLGLVIKREPATGGGIPIKPTGQNIASIDSARFIYWYHSSTPYGETGRWNNSRRWDSGSWSED